MKTFKIEITPYISDKRLRINKPIEGFINENNCHVCTSHSDVRGYPMIHIKGKSRRMNRYIYEKNFGEIPEGLFILHSCDNPACINIEHLRAGTNADNTMDRILRNRSSRTHQVGRKGSSHNKAKLSEKDILEIRKSNLKNARIAEIYGVKPACISKIKLNKTWRHI